jgi:hypothetical protein
MDHGSGVNKMWKDLKKENEWAIKDDEKDIIPAPDGGDGDDGRKRDCAKDCPSQLLY